MINLIAARCMNSHIFYRMWKSKFLCIIVIEFVFPTTIMVKRQIGENIGDFLQIQNLAIVSYLEVYLIF